LVGIELFLL